jgi:hypothetical protein
VWQINPNSGRNHYFCGITAYMEGDFDKAIQYYRSAQVSIRGHSSRGQRGIRSVGETQQRLLGRITVV